MGRCMSPTWWRNVYSHRIQGLRGIASITVVITHLARAFDRELFAPNNGDGAWPRVLQLPFIRVFIQGRIGVAIFSLVTGYVCALKPIRLARASKYEEAVIAVSKSAFRRVPRLILPTTIITVIIWFLCQFGAFEIAKRSESEWMSVTSPTITPFFGDALFDLCNQWIRTWVYGQNFYDPNQWTLHPLLKGSMLVYMMVFATLYCQPKYRMMMCMAMYIYYWVAQECKSSMVWIEELTDIGAAVFGMQFFFGFFMSDLQNLPPSPAPLSLSRYRRIWQLLRAPLFFTFGMYIASYPEMHPDRATWSKHLQYIASWILPEGYDTARFYSAWGLEFIVLAIHYSPRAKDILANQTFLWLGKNSFAVYLLHGTLIRTLLAWAIFGVTMPLDQAHEDGTITPGPNLKAKGPWTKAFWFPVFFVLLYAVSHVWTTRVDPKCAEWSRAIEKYTWKEESKDGLLGQQARVVANKDDEKEASTPIVTINSA